MVKSAKAGEGLALRHRPRRLEDIRGQDKAVAQLRNHLETGSNQSVLLVGPSGTGKTSIARIAGASLLCDDTPPVACGQCTSCLEILAGKTFTFGWYEMDAARFSEKRHMDDIVRLARGEHPFKWAAFLDEIHALHGDAADALLKSVEEPGPNSHFFAATTDLSAVRPALRKRCLVVHFKPLSGAQSYKLLSEVCQAEKIRYEPVALDMIGSASEGSARDALNKLDQIAGQGDVTADLVAETLAFGSMAFVLAYFKALLSADVAAQEAALYEWQEETVQKARMIRNFLLYCYNFEVASPPIKQVVDPAFYQITCADRQPLVAEFRARASALARSLEQYWFDLLGLWEFDPAMMVDHASLSIRSRRFHALVNRDIPIPPTSISTVSAPAQTRAYRSRSTKLALTHTPTSSEDYLDLARAEAIYDSASFLPQQYGLLFNVGITIDHAALGEGGEDGVQALISDLTHELDLRVRGWVRGERAHWLYMHERRAAGLFTDIIAHVPPATFERLESWLFNRLVDWRGDRARSRDTWSLDLPKAKVAVGYTRLRVLRHWQLIRGLWRGLGPQVGHWNEEGLRVPLAELLGVPRSERRSIGVLARLRRSGSSRSLGPDARRRAEAGKMKLLSAFADNAWTHIDTGWELDEWVDRRLELEQRRDAEERLELEWPVSSNELEMAGRAEAFNRLHENWPDDPHCRLRAWAGWWA